MSSQDLTGRAARLLGIGVIFGGLTFAGLIPANFVCFKALWKFGEALWKFFEDPLDNLHGLRRDFIDKLERLQKEAEKKDPRFGNEVRNLNRSMHGIFGEKPEKVDLKKAFEIVSKVNELSKRLRCLARTDAAVNTALQEVVDVTTRFYHETKRQQARLSEQQGESQTGKIFEFGKKVVDFSRALLNLANTFSEEITGRPLISFANLIKQLQTSTTFKVESSVLRAVSSKSTTNTVQEGNCEPLSEFILESCRHSFYSEKVPTEKDTTSDPRITYTNSNSYTTISRPTNGVQQGC